MNIFAARQNHKPSEACFLPSSTLMSFFLTRRVELTNLWSLLNFTESSDCSSSDCSRDWWRESERGLILQRRRREKVARVNKKQKKKINKELNKYIKKKKKLTLKISFQFSITIHGCSCNRNRWFKMIRQRRYNTWMNMLWDFKRSFTTRQIVELCLGWRQS